MLHIGPAVWWEDGHRCLPGSQYDFMSPPWAGHQEKPPAAGRETLMLTQELEDTCWVNFCYMSPHSSRDRSCSRLVFHLGFWVFYFFKLESNRFWSPAEVLYCFPCSPSLTDITETTWSEAGSLGIRRKTRFSALGHKLQSGWDAAHSQQGDSI